MFFLIILGILLSSFSFSAKAQTYRIDGIVTDSATRQKLAFVNIIVNNDGRLGTTSDIDGKFTVISENVINTLTFFFVGYRAQTIAITPEMKSCNIRLKADIIELQEVVIHAGENPAHRIIDSLLLYRDKNNPEKLQSYSYTIYDRMIMTLDTLGFSESDSTAAMFKEQILREKDLMVMETVSEQFHQHPGKDRKNVLATKISGMKDPFFFYILDEVQSSSFYDDYITVFSKKYVNPISRGSKSKYFFNIESATPASDKDTVFQISFKPRRGTNFDALKGVLTVHSDGWAIQNVKAEPDDNESVSVKIQQKYEKVDSTHWFPRQLNTDIIFNMAAVRAGESNIPIIGTGKSYISDIKINTELNKKTFNNISIDVNPEAGFRDDNYWIDYRYDSLDERILKTYQFIDSIGEAEHFDRFAKILQSLGSSTIPIWIFDLDLGKIIDFNVGNGLYLGLGGSTNDRFSRTFKINTFWGYWFKAKATNYGGDISILLKKSHDTRFTIYGERKFERFGNYGFRTQGSILEAENFKYFYVDKTTFNTKVAVELSTCFSNSLKTFLKFSLADKDVNGYRFINGDSTFSQRFRMADVEFNLRFAYKEKFMQTAKGIKSLGSDYPIVWLSYHKNLSGVFDSPFNFDKLQIQVRGDHQMRYFGKSSFCIQAGIVDGAAPLFELFNMFGTWMWDFDLYAPMSFNTMRIDEFFCDRFVSVFLSHNFGSLLFKTKRFKPELIVATNMAWGDISHSERHEGVELNSIEKGFYESGLIIDNLLSTPISKIGLGGFYRYGPYAYNDTLKNFSFRFSITFEV